MFSKPEKTQKILLERTNKMSQYPGTVDRRRLTVFPILQIVVKFNARLSFTYMS